MPTRERRVVTPVTIFFRRPFSVLCSSTVCSVRATNWERIVAAAWQWADGSRDELRSNGEGKREPTLLAIPTSRLTHTRFIDPLALLLPPPQPSHLVSLAYAACYSLYNVTALCIQGKKGEDSVRSFNFHVGNRSKRLLVTRRRVAIIAHT